MHDFCYVSKREAALIKAELIDLIHRVQDYVRDDFTFQYYFVGSSSRNCNTFLWILFKFRYHRKTRH